MLWIVENVKIALLVKLKTICNVGPLFFFLYKIGSLANYLNTIVVIIEKPNSLVDLVMVIGTETQNRVWRCKASLAITWLFKKEQNDIGPCRALWHNALK